MPITIWVNFIDHSLITQCHRLILPRIKTAIANGFQQRKRNRLAQCHQPVYRQRSPLSPQHLINIYTRTILRITTQAHQQTKYDITYFHYLAFTESVSAKNGCGSISPLLFQITLNFPSDLIYPIIAYFAKWLILVSIFTSPAGESKESPNSASRTFSTSKEPAFFAAFAQRYTSV